MSHATACLRGDAHFEGRMTQPRTGIDPAIVDYYERAPEESRLKQGAFQLEQARTRGLIERHAPPPPAEVLDVGGAAGAYVLWLAERGYTVHFLDAMPRLVEEARRRSEAAARGLASCRVADAKSLPVSPESVSLVLMLGPLYHLVDAADRATALRGGRASPPPGGRAHGRGNLSLGLRARWARSRSLWGRALPPHRRARPPRRPATQPDRASRLLHDGVFPSTGRVARRAGGAGLDAVGLYGIEGPAWIVPDMSRRLEDAARTCLLWVRSRPNEART